jgi:hypothetical protein
MWPIYLDSSPCRTTASRSTIKQALVVLVVVMRFINLEI